MTNSTYIPVKKSELKKITASLTKASRLLEKISNDKPIIPDIPLAPKEEREAFLRDKEAQRAVRESREERSKDGGIPAEEFFKQLEEED